MLEAEEMACQELVEVVTEYLEGTLPAEDRARLEAHLGRCDACCTYLEQMRQTIDLAGTLSAEAITPTEQRDMLKLFHNWRSAG